MDDGVFQIPSLNEISWLAPFHLAFPANDISIGTAPVPDDNVSLLNLADRDPTRFHTGRLAGYTQSAKRGQ